MDSQLHRLSKFHRESLERISKTNSGKKSEGFLNSGVTSEEIRGKLSEKNT